VKRQVIALILFAAIGLQMAWLFVWRPTGHPPPRTVPNDGSMEAAAAARPRIVDVTSPQYLKLQEASRIASDLETFQAAAAALDAPLTEAQSDLLSYAGDTGGGMFLDRAFPAAMADYRLARMYELLRAMPVDTARENLRTLFLRKLEDWSDLWAKLAPILQRARSGGSNMDLERHYRAIAICVVLSGAILPKDEAIEWCREWESHVERAMQATAFDPVAYESRVRDRLRDAIPSREFRLSFCLWLAQRHGCPFRQVDHAYEGNTHDGFPVLEETIVTRADWLPDGKPPDEAAILFRAPWLRSWGPFDHPEHQRRALDRAYQLLATCP
jgi:hypothetical protein